MMWLCLLFVSLPLYLIRFPLFGIPATLLECVIGAATLFTIYKLITNTAFREESKKRLFALQEEKILLAAIILFIIGATLGVYYSLHLRAALGEWKAFYIEPLLIALLTFIHVRTRKDIHQLIYSLFVGSIILGLYTIVQRFTGFGVPYAFWENGASYRVTGWYGFPNAVGQALFPSAILSLGLFIIHTTEKTIRIKESILYTAAFFTSILGILFAKSTGSLLAVIAGMGIFLVGYKKTRIPSLILGGIMLISLFLLPSDQALRQELLAENRSGQIRVSMWKEAIEFLRANPFSGAGLASYTDRIVPYHTQVNGENIEIFHHPHNMFLTMWVNIGLFGFVGYVLLLVWVGKKSITLLQSNILFALLPLAVMVGFIVAGLVDSPYIKNDMSVLFWFFPTIIVYLIYERKIQTT
jgi:O-antigen ligase